MLRLLQMLHSNHNERAAQHQSRLLDFAQKTYEKWSLETCEASVISYWKYTVAKQASNLDVDVDLKAIVANEDQLPTPMGDTAKTSMV